MGSKRKGPAGTEPSLGNLLIESAKKIIAKGTADVKPVEELKEYNLLAEMMFKRNSRVK